jgi:hypothetical protein
MIARLSSLLALAVLLVAPTLAKDKKPVIPEDVLRAQTVLVVVDPDAGAPLDQPRANSVARDNVEKALMEWGRFRLVMEGDEPDLIITVATGDSRAVRPTIRGGPIDSRPGYGQTTDSSVRIGGHQGQAPPMNDPSMNPPDPRPHVSNEVGPTVDTFAVYRGGARSAPLDTSPVWRYVAKDCLRPSPLVPAVEKFRKMLADAEKPQQTKKP